VKFDFEDLWFWCYDHAPIVLIISLILSLVCNKVSIILFQNQNLFGGYVFSICSAMFLFIYFGIIFLIFWDIPT